MPNSLRIATILFAVLLLAAMVPAIFFTCTSDTQPASGPVREQIQIASFKLAATAASRPILPPPAATQPQTQPATADVRVVSATSGDVRLVPLAPATQPGHLFDIGRDEGLVSDDMLLRLELLITNHGSKPISYRPWHDSGVLLTDEQGNAYPAGLLAGSLPEGACRAATSVPPGAAIHEVLVFQRPKHVVRLLKLVLPGSNIGQDPPVVIAIPATAIHPVTDR